MNSSGLIAERYRTLSFTGLAYLKSFQNIAPTLRCRPDLVQGMPVARETRRLAPVIPTNRFQLKPPLFITAPFFVSRDAGRHGNRLRTQLHVRLKAVERTAGWQVLTGVDEELVVAADVFGPRGAGRLALTVHRPSERNISLRLRAWKHGPGR